MIELTCSHCASQLKIDKQYVGQSGRCNRCGGAVVVPNRLILTRRDFAIGAAALGIFILAALSSVISEEDDRPANIPEPKISEENNPASISERNTPKLSQDVVGLGIGRARVKRAFPSPEFTMEEGAPVNGDPSLLGQAANSNTLVQMVGPRSNLHAVSVMVVLEQENTQSRRRATAYLRSMTELAATWATDWVGSNLSKSERGETVSIEQENTIVKLTGIPLSDGAIVTLQISEGPR
jgi:ribosomal protein S14